MTDLNAWTSNLGDVDGDALLEGEIDDPLDEITYFADERASGRTASPSERLSMTLVLLDSSYRDRALSILADRSVTLLDALEVSADPRVFASEIEKNTDLDLPGLTALADRLGIRPNLDNELEESAKRIVLTGDSNYSLDRIFEAHQDPAAAKRNAMQYAFDYTEHSFVQDRPGGRRSSLYTLNHNSIPRVTNFIKRYYEEYPDLIHNYLKAAFYFLLEMKDFYNVYNLLENNKGIIEINGRDRGLVSNMILEVISRGDRSLEWPKPAEFLGIEVDSGPILDARRAYAEGQIAAFPAEGEFGRNTSNLAARVERSNLDIETDNSIRRALLAKLEALCEEADFELALEFARAFSLGQIIMAGGHTYFQHIKASIQ